MKTKNLLIAITVSIVTVLGFTTCLDNGKGDSYSYTYASPAIVNYDMSGLIFLGTAYGTFIPDNTSALSLSSLPNGSSIYMSFDYNSEYQTNPNYPVASNINYTPVEVDNIQQEDSAMAADYNFPLSSVQLFDQSLSVNYSGKFFVATYAKLGMSQTLQHYSYIKADESPDATGSRNVYLQAKLSTAPTGSQDVATVYGIDMVNLIFSSGRDTTMMDNYGTSHGLKYMKVNLKYCSSINNEVPVFQSVNTQPIYIYILKAEL
jgi:hypothetical protein